MNGCVKQDAVTKMGRFLLLVVAVMLFSGCTFVRGRNATTSFWALSIGRSYDGTLTVEGLGTAAGKSDVSPQDALIVRAAVDAAVQAAAKSAKP